MAAPAIDPVWETAECLTRLQNMPTEPPPHHEKHGDEVVHHDPASFMDGLRAHACQAMDNELLDNRVDLWDTEPVAGEEPDWMCLRGKTPEAHKKFHHWARVIHEDLGCDESACQAFIKLFNMAPREAPHGYMEACRVLAHIFKDKSKDQEYVHGPNWSRFVQKACEEAIEALEDPTHVKSMQRNGGGWKDWNAYNVGPPGPQMSSSSWEHGGKGKTKGKGKGVFFQRGALS